MDYHIAAHSVYYCNRLEYELVRFVRVTARGTITRQPVAVEQEQTCRVQYEGHPLTRHMCDWHDCYIVWSHQSNTVLTCHCNRYTDGHPVEPECLRD